MSLNRHDWISLETVDGIWSTKQNLNLIDINCFHTFDMLNEVNNKEKNRYSIVSNISIEFLYQFIDQKILYFISNGFLCIIQDISFKVI